MKLAFRARAVRDIDGIFDYSVTTHVPDVAKAYLRDIHALIALVPEYLELGTVSDVRRGNAEIASGKRKTTIFGKISFVPEINLVVDMDYFAIRLRDIILKERNLDRR